jgi:shikimate kinase
MEDEFDDVLKKREPLYKKVSSLAFDTDSIGADELADLIIKELTI